MSDKNELLPLESSVAKKLAEQSIVLPESPFWEILKDFGKDELIALAINAFGVAGLSTISTDPVLLTIMGPLLEKIGFFVDSSLKAWNVYATTPREERKAGHKYAWDAIRNGLPNLKRDLLLHDPMYAGLLLLELQQFPETPAWMLSVIAFMISIAAVSAIEVTANEVGYQKELWKFKKWGFSLEKQLESRFIVQEQDSSNVLKELAEYFKLGDIHTSNYRDRYFQPLLKSYNSRTSNIRVRERTEPGQKPELDSIQVLYTRASRVKNKHPEQYNYYPVAKDKLQLPLDASSQQYLDLMTKSDETHEVSFTRQFANIENEMLISTDRVNDGENSYTVIEVKSFRDQKDAVNKMIEAMRYIMVNYSVVQTTHSKHALTSLQRS